MRMSTGVPKKQRGKARKDMKLTKAMNDPGVIDKQRGKTRKDMKITKDMLAN